MLPTSSTPCIRTALGLLLGGGSHLQTPIRQPHLKRVNCPSPGPHKYTAERVINFFLNGERNREAQSRHHSVVTCTYMGGLPFGRVKKFLGLSQIGSNWSEVWWRMRRRTEPAKDRLNSQRDSRQWHLSELTRIREPAQETSKHKWMALSGEHIKFAKNFGDEHDAQILRLECFHRSSSYPKGKYVNNA